MGDRAKPLLVIDHLGAGGAQEFLYQLCERLPRDRVQVSVCALLHGGVYEEKLRGLGVPVHVLSAGPLLQSLPRILLRLHALMCLGGYTAVHTFLQVSLALATPLSRMTGLPTIHSIVALRSQTQRWYFPLMYHYQRWTAAFLCFCPSEQLEYGFSPSKLKSVEITAHIDTMLGIRHDGAAPIEPYDLSDAHPVVISIGRLHPDKGHHYAIEAWPAVLRQWARAKLLIVGDGDDRERLEKMARELDVADSVLFAGYRSDLGAIFARADIMLRTSVNEGVNMTTIQGMAAGLPVIGFRNGAPKEIISDGGNGILLPMGHSQALSEAICALSSDRALRARLGETARQKVAQYYSIEPVVHFHSLIYQTLQSKASIADVPDMSAAIATFRTNFSSQERRG